MRKKTTVKILCALITAFLTSGWMPANAASINHNISGGSLSIAGSSTDDYVITGTTTSYSVSIASGYQGTITLDNVSISGASPIRVYGQNNLSNATPVTKVTVIIKGMNVIQGTNDQNAAFQVDQGAQIHIRAIDPVDDTSGSLTVIASSATGAAAGSTYGSAAAIGAPNAAQGTAIIYNANGSIYSNSGNTSGGNIIISSGTIVANGGYHGAGIGGAHSTGGWYNGYIVIYGGNITCRGGGHSAGIGTGCPKGSGNDGTYAANGTIVAIPPASITATTTQSGKAGLAGAANITYIGDPQSPVVTVETEDNERYADIYADLSETTSIVSVFNTLGIDHDLTKVKFGNTGSAGNMQFRATLKQPVTFFTDASSSATATLGRPYKPKTVPSVSAATTVTLLLLDINMAFEVVASTPLETGYIAAQAQTNAYKIKITYSDSKPMTNVSYGLQNENATEFTGLTFYGPDGVSVISPLTTLSNGTVFYISVPIKNGKPVGIYSDVLRFSGTWDGASTGYIRQVVTQRVVYNDTNTNTYIKVTASPASFRTNNPGTANVTLSLNINHAGLTVPYDATDVKAKYLITTQSDYDLALAATPLASWTNLNIPASDGASLATAVSFSGKPDNTYYIHWYVESGTVYAHSKTVVNPTAMYGGFGAYIIDTSAPSVTLKVDGSSTAKTIADLTALPVLLEFNESINNPGSELTSADFEILPAGIASISGIAAVAGSDDKHFDATLTPANTLYNGQSFTVKLKANTVTDLANNSNTAASNTVTVTLSNTSAVPAVTFNNAAIYSSLTPSFTVDIVPGDYAINSNTDLFLTAGGTPINTAANLNSLFVITPENGAPLTTGYNAIYSKTGSGAGAKGVVTITFSTSLQNSKSYTIALAADKFYNKLQNGNAAGNATFLIALPDFTGISSGISADPSLFGSEGGTTELTVRGSALKLNADNGLLSLRVACPEINYNSNAITTGFITPLVGTEDYVIISGVPVPANTGTTTKTYTFTLYMTFDGVETSTGKTCTIQVEPAASYIVSVTNGTSSVNDLIFGYTSAQAQDTYCRQNITVTNNGAQELNDLTVSFIGTNGVAFESTLPSPVTHLAPGNNATFYVYLKTGQNAGTYAGGPAGSETKVVVNATLGSDASPVSGNAVLVQQKVTPKTSVNPDDEGGVTGNPAPSTAWSNQAALQLTASAVGAGNSVTDWQYAVVDVNTTPGDLDPAWVSVGGGTIATTYTFPAGTNGDRYVFWKLNTSNVTHIAGQVEANGVKVYRRDLIAPAIVSIIPSLGTTNANPFTAQVTFSEPVSLVDATRLVATNASVGNPVPAGAPEDGRYTAYVITVTPAAGLASNDVITLSVQAGAAKDRAGNDNTASTILTNTSIVFNNEHPSVLLTTPDLTVNSNFVVTATFSKRVFGLTESDWDVNNGASIFPGSLTGSDGDSIFTVMISTGGVSSGDITVAIPDESAVDAAGNDNEAGSLTVSYVSPADKIAAVLNYSGPAYENDPFIVNVSFTRNVTGLTATDFSYNTSDFGVPDLSGSGKNYILTFTPNINKDGVTNISLNGVIAARDEYGNELNGSNTVTVRYDTRRPLVSSATTPHDTIHYEPFTVKIVFDEAGIDFFDPGKLILTNLQYLGVESGPVTVGTTTEYEISVQAIPDAVSKTRATLQIDEGTVKDKAGNPNVAGGSGGSTSINVLFIDNVPPAVISVSPFGSSVQIYGNIVITFSEPMNPAPGTVRLSDVGRLTDGKWTSRTTYVLPYGPLAYEETYTISISEFYDPAGNPIEPVRSSFTTLKPAIPDIQRQIVLLVGDGLKIAPEAPTGGNTYFLSSGRNFVFTVSPLPGYTLEDLEITTGVDLRDREGIKRVTNEDGSITVTILKVTEPLTITIGLGPVANVNVEKGTRIWSYDQELYVRSDKSATLKIFSSSGQLYKSQAIAEGETKIPLPPGLYLIILGENSVFRIIIR
jgi:hypothetical protein